jgi:hypothetical protein
MGLPGITKQSLIILVLIAVLAFGDVAIGEHVDTKIGANYKPHAARILQIGLEGPGQTAPALRAPHYLPPRRPPVASLHCHWGKTRQQRNSGPRPWAINTHHSLLQPAITSRPHRRYRACGGVQTICGSLWFCERCGKNAAGDGTETARFHRPCRPVC